MIAALVMISCSQSSPLKVYSREKLSPIATRVVVIGTQSPSFESAIGKLQGYIDARDKYSEIVWLDHVNALGMIERPFGGSADGTPYLKFKIGAFLMGSRQSYGSIVRLVAAGGRAQLERLSESPFAASARYELADLPFGGDKSSMPFSAQYSLLSIRRLIGKGSQVGVEAFFRTEEQPNCRECFELREQLSTWLQSDVVRVRLGRVPIFDDQDGVASPLVFLFGGVDPIRYWQGFGELNDEQTASRIFSLAKGQVMCETAYASSCAVE